ncbi:MAG: hypothetical protein WAU07_04235 [Microgenomates group bacterium]
MQEFLSVNEDGKEKNPAIVDEFKDLVKLWQTKELSGEEDAEAVLEILKKIESRAKEIMEKWPVKIALAAAIMASFMFGEMRVNYFDQTLAREGINLMHWIAFGGLGAAAGLAMGGVTYPIARRLGKMKAESLLDAGVQVFGDDLPRDQS